MNTSLYWVTTCLADQTENMKRHRLTAYTELSAYEIMQARVAHTCRCLACVRFFGIKPEIPF